ncbi:LysR family transcriptional regulator [Tropicimonas sediminicola]|uniref:DNA-binding transcriptional regulator, LysR family n=1 Tax=Tropicimonas sediminicola TaxID=1031541 RepID=A0A239HV73_9RHOB|nr:LysR family transcriptional regulator [Tropicimonas sediminicola]SNS85205.1 DNA-binding transcriptional regulator, LysR family [Tropicimonas sediminicola]
MAMDKNLVAFLVVAETGNLTEAAKRLGLAQPSLTKRLKLLEDEYGTRLFDRQPRGMFLTPIGRELLDHAKRIEQRYVQAREAIEAEKSNRLDVLRVGAGPLFRRAFLVPAFERLRQEHPETRLEIRADVHLQNLPHLRHGELDIVFGALASDIDEEDIDTVEIVSAHLGALASVDHPLHRKDRVSAGDLAGIPWVLYSNDAETTAMVRGFFVRNALNPPEFAVTTSSYEFGLDLVATGKFIMPAPMELDPNLSALGMRSLPLADPIDSFLAGAYVRRSSLSYPVVRRLLDLVCQMASRHAPPPDRQG